MQEPQLNPGSRGHDQNSGVPPGTILKEKMSQHGFSLKDLARISGVSPIHLSQIIGGKRRITAESAFRIGAWFHTEPGFWLGLQAEFDLSLARQSLAVPSEFFTSPEVEPHSKTIIQMPSADARKFLLKSESYCTIPIPDYFKFGPLLESVRDALSTEELTRQGVRDKDGVNHRIMTNKDGRFAWRPLEIIHPALYISLVQEITRDEHWQTILDRFGGFSANERIRCLSLPVESLTKEKDMAEQILSWHTAVEQKSLELSLDYEYLIQTDIEDCYPSIYTHSIAWALHGKEFAKKPDQRRNENLVGNVIDWRIQDMHLGQTNGIPQGSVLMDFIAEMVLGYADTELTKRCAADDGIKEYQILRYRDDYRIFVNSPSEGERILKHLTEALIDLGLKLNPGKTDSSSMVVRSSIKHDKLAWMFRKQTTRNLQNRLLIIYDHGLEYPNSGAFISALQAFHERLHRLQRYSSPLPLLAIAVDIAFRNPRTYPYVAAIVGELIKFVKNDWDKLAIVDRIRHRFSRVPNSGHMDLWLQRISFQYDLSIPFGEPLCRLVSQDETQVWNNDWITSQGGLAAMDPSCLVDRDRLWEMEPTISPEELRLFASAY